jgi:hydrogenase maturation factor
VSVDPDGLSALVRGQHGTQSALLLALEPEGRPIEAGDWLLVHSGLAVQRISEDEARDLLDFLGHTVSTEEVQ